MLSKTFTVFGAVAVFLGVIMLMGSAGDCDGHCMDQANDMATMLMYIGYGLVMMLGGFFCLLAGRALEDH